MNKTRLEAFSDGVLAIIITIMVLELKAPHEGTLEAIRAVGMPLCAYILSFLYVGIYWNNHHHMLHAAKRVNGSVLWANLHLLFWLSLIPFVTDWVGESHLSALPTAAYGLVLLFAAVAYLILQQRILQQEGEASVLARAVGRDRKGRISPFGYAAGIVAAFWHPWISALLYFAVALIWLIPDSRIEQEISGKEL